MPKSNSSTTNLLSANKVHAGELVNSLESTPVALNKWNITEIKVAFDDLVVRYMREEANYDEDHFLINLRLVMSVLLNVIGGGTALYSYFIKPFERTRWIVAVGVSAYLLLSTLWSYLLQYRVWTTTFRSNPTNSKDSSIWLVTEMKYPQVLYSIEVIDGRKVQKGALRPNQKSNAVVAKIEFPVGHWIDEDGVVCGEALVADLNAKVLPKFALLSTKSD